MKYRTEYDKEEIGRNLRACRKRRNLSVEEVREYLRMGSVQAIYKWENGKSYPQCHPSDYMMAFSSDYSDAMLPPENVMGTFSNAVSSY